MTHYLKAFSIFKTTLIWGVGAAVLLCAGGCTDKKKPLEGERISILLLGEMPQIDADAPAVEIPAPIQNRAWPTAGGTPAHDMPPVTLHGLSHIRWTARAGSGASFPGCLTANPIATDDAIFAMDGTGGVVTAIFPENGHILWSAQVSTRTTNACALGGGLAFDGDVVYVTTPIGEIIALDAETGNIQWQKDLETPIRVAPTVEEGRIYVVTVTNHLEVLDQKTGEKLWSHEGMPEVTGLVGGAAPAVAHGIVVVTYTSGEVYALRADNGHYLWSDTLSATRMGSSVATVAHIRARPIITGSHVYVLSHSGRLVCYDARLGTRIWEKAIGGTRTPAIGGNFLFIATNNGDLMCLTADTGKIVWVQKLPEDAEAKHKRLAWAGPVLVNRSLLLTNSRREAVLFSAADGSLEQTLTLGAPTFLSPIVSEGVAYFLLDNATLVAVD